MSSEQKLLIINPNPTIFDLKFVISSLEVLVELLQEKNKFNDEDPIYENLFYLIATTREYFEKTDFPSLEDGYVPKLEDFDFYLSDNEPMPIDIISKYNVIIGFMVRNAA